MFLQSEDRGAIDCLVRAHAFKNRQTVMQRMRQHMSGRGAPLDQLAIVPDIAIAVGHRHGIRLPGIVWVERATQFLCAAARNAEIVTESP